MLSFGNTNYHCAMQCNLVRPTLQTSSFFFFISRCTSCTNSVLSRWLPETTCRDLSWNCLHWGSIGLDSYELERSEQCSRSDHNSTVEYAVVAHTAMSRDVSLVRRMLWSWRELETTGRNLLNCHSSFVGTNSGGRAGFPTFDHPPCLTWWNERDVFHKKKSL